LASSRHPLEIARLLPAIQHYDWGSRSFLAALRGTRAPSDAPEAELWLGVHPRGEARVVAAAGATIPLGEWIARDPADALGADVASRGGATLPFLLKILAVERALSLQAHPDVAQARAGFEREERAGIAPEARLYADPSDKPELVVALTPFHALSGFRPLEEIRALFATAGLGDLAPSRGAEAETWLRAFFARWLAEDDVATRVARIERALAAPPGDRAFAWMHTLAEQHPRDPGVIAPLLLNAVELAPGDALFLEAGELHCYLEGAAVEIMASSDNVLRAGLTPKPRAVAELLRIGRFAPAAPRAVRADSGGRYATPASAFELSRLAVGRGGRALDVPRIAVLLCVEGGVRVAPDGEGHALVLGSGEACVVPAAIGRVRLDGAGVVFAASVPAEPPRVGSAGLR
jgi:mannose-6-phosphate isomerase